MAGDLPNRIREHRKARGLTLEWLANRVNCTISQLSNLERGDRVLNLHWMERIAKALKVRPADLLNESPDDLSPGEWALIRRYRKASEEERSKIQALIDVFLVRKP